MTYVPDPLRYDTMRYRRSGRSGLMLPEISLGLWQNFGGTRPIATQRAILRRAFDLGVTHIDLANNYGPPYGSAESNFGRILAEDFRPFRDELVISTKAGWDMWPGPYGDHGSRKYLLASLDQSLRRMGLDYVDIFYHHRPDPETPIEETAGALATAITSGKALYVGISAYSPEQTTAMVEALAPHNIRLLIHQPAYNMFNRTIEQGLFPVLEEHGIGAIAFVPLAQGLLTDRYLGGTVPAGSRAATSPTLSSDQITETYLERVRALNEIAKDRGQTLAQLALSWILRQPRITSALIGASSVEQLEQNVGALSFPPLTGDEIAAIEPYATALP
ncbi:MAG TPA: L-glyceraldehyde 3-phosphate reductase [Thermomicrobiales bacterium]|nr:L-glyceraldehyde 3-phosphate reductase [Thermomicrobiales bacterium]